MKLPRRTFLHLAVGAAALPAILQTARAQAYPTRPITMIVPFPPGGANDMLGRIIAERMRGILSQSIIIENIGGAAGSIGGGAGHSLARGRLHAQHWLGQLARSCRRDLPITLRSREGSGTGRTARIRAADDCRKERHAGGEPEGIDRVAEGQPR